jgi:hypothetical protein
MSLGVKSDETTISPPSSPGSGRSTPAAAPSPPVSRPRPVAPTSPPTSPSDARGGNTPKSPLSPRTIPTAPKPGLSRSNSVVLQTSKEVQAGGPDDETFAALLLDAAAADPSAEQPAATLRTARAAAVQAIARTLDRDAVGVLGCMDLLRRYPVAEAGFILAVRELLGCWPQRRAAEDRGVQTCGSDPLASSSGARLSPSRASRSMERLRGTSSAREGDGDSEPSPQPRQQEPPSPTVRGEKSSEIAPLIRPAYHVPRWKQESSADTTPRATPSATPVHDRHVAFIDPEMNDAGRSPAPRQPGGRRPLADPFAEAERLDPDFERRQPPWDPSDVRRAPPRRRSVSPRSPVKQPVGLSPGAMRAIHAAKATTATRKRGFF